MTETIDTANLRALAEAAPAGPWNPPQELAHRGTVYDRDLGALLTYKSISTERDQCVRYVAAANPAVMLALLDRLATAEARNATLTDDAARELIEIARDIEALKRECGMDPESPVAIQNGRYMALSYKVRALAATKEKTP